MVNAQKQPNNMSLHPDSSFLAPRRHASLMSRSRPVTSHIPHTTMSLSPDMTHNRLSYQPQLSHRSSDWDLLRTAAMSENTVLISESHHSTHPQPAQQHLHPQRSHVRRPSIADSIRNGITNVRSLGRRMSLSMRGKPRSSQDERPSIQEITHMFNKDAGTIDRSDSFTGQPRNVANHLRSRRRPSMPILKYVPVPEPERQTRVAHHHRAVTIVHRPDCPPGGAGARASAAAQNEIYYQSRSTPLPPYRPRSESFEEYRDNESGIGIAIDGLERSDSYRSPHPVKCDPADLLAPELLEHILTFLDAPTLLELELVSKRWRDLCQSQVAWRQVFYREYAPTRPNRVLGAPKQAGLGKNATGQDYRKLYQVRKLIDKRWTNGEAAAIYLNGHKDSVYCVQFDEDKIITGSRDNTIRIWDARTYQCLRKLGPPNNSRERSTIIRPDVEPTGIKPFFMSDAISAEPRNRHPPIWHQASVLCLQYDSEILVTGSSDFTCIVWSIKDDYEPLFRLTGHRAGVLDVCIDATRIITCSKDSTIKIWNRFTGSLIKTLAGHKGPVNAVQVRGNLLASASGDTMAKLWRLDTGMCIKEFHSKERGLACVEFSEDGRTIFAGGNDHVIYQYDTTNGNIRRELTGHDKLVRSLHLDSANSRIISGSYDHTIKVWDSKSGANGEDGGLKLSLDGWTSSWMLAAKSNYRKIACASQDGRVVVVDFGFGIQGVDLVEA